MQRQIAASGGALEYSPGAREDLGMLCNNLPTFSIRFRRRWHSGASSQTNRVAVQLQQRVGKLARQRQRSAGGADTRKQQQQRIQASATETTGRYSTGRTVEQTVAAVAVLNQMKKCEICCRPNRKMEDPAVAILQRAMVKAIIKSADMAEDLQSAAIEAAQEGIVDFFFKNQKRKQTHATFSSLFVFVKDPFASLSFLLSSRFQPLANLKRNATLHNTLKRNLTSNTVKCGTASSARRLDRLCTQPF